MPRVAKRSVLSGISVKEAMRRQVIQLPPSAAVDYCINRMIKYKINSVLLLDDNRRPAGVASKTDVMSKPVVSSHADTELAHAIQQMLLKDVQRLFVHGQVPGQIVGILSLSDAARFRAGSCRACTSSRLMQA